MTRYTELEAKLEEIDEVIDEMLRNWDTLTPQEERNFWRIQALKVARTPYTEDTRSELYYGDCPNHGSRTYGDLYESEEWECCVRRCRDCDAVVEEGIPF